MHIPDDPQYYEKFYFTPGDLGFRSLGHALRPDRRARLLGPVVSRGRAAHGAERRADPVLSHRHRLAPAGEGGVRRAAAGRLGNDPAQPRDRQRLLCVRRQSRGPRGRRRRRHRVLGRQLRGRSGGRIIAKGGDGRGSARSPSAISTGSNAAARTGRSCAIGGSTPIGTSRRRYWTEPCRAKDSSCPGRRRPSWVIACRPSGSRTGHLAELAAQGSVLARQVRAGAGVFARWSASWRRTRRSTSTSPARHGAGRRATCWPTRARTPRSVFSPHPDQRRLVPRSRADLRRA